MLRKTIFQFCQSIEKRMEEKLMKALQATKVEVIDTSSGCGDMYRIEVISSLFENQSKIKQHQMVLKVLQDDLKSAHGYSIKTEIAKSK